MSVAQISTPNGFSNASTHAPRYPCVTFEDLGITVYIGGQGALPKDSFVEKHGAVRSTSPVIYIPDRAFEIHGAKNFAEIEFLCYYGAFIKNGLANNEPLNIVCSEEVKNLITKYLQLTLFGPDFLEDRYKNSVTPEDAVLLSTISNMIRTPKVDGDGCTVRTEIEDFVRFTTIEKDIQSILTICSGKEKSDKGNVRFELDSNGLLTMESNNGQKEEFNTNKHLPAVERDIPSPSTEQIENIQKFIDSGVTFIANFGNSTGFDPNGLHTSFVYSICGSINISIDPSIEANKMYSLVGLNNPDYILLTHTHFDHDSGVLERILAGKKTNLICSKAVYEMLKEKVEITLSMQGENVITKDKKINFDNLINYTELKVGHDNQLDLANGEQITIKLGWNIHNVPTNSVSITHRGKTFAHSSDTIYSEDIFKKLQDEFNKNGLDSTICTNFIDEIKKRFFAEQNWDILTYEAGAGAIHTTIENIEKALNLSNLTEEKRAKIIQSVFCYHTPNSYDDKDIKRIPVYHAVAVGEQNDVEINEINLLKTKLLRKLSENPIFATIRKPELQELISAAKIITLQPGEALYNDGEKSNHEFHVVFSGALEIDLEDNNNILAAQGSEVGAWGAILETPRYSTVKASSNYPFTRVLCFDESAISKILQLCPYLKNDLEKIKSFSLSFNSYFEKVFGTHIHFTNELTRILQLTMGEGMEVLSNITGDITPKANGYYFIDKGILVDSEDNHYDAGFVSATKILSTDSNECCLVYFSEEAIQLLRNNIPAIENYFYANS